MEELTPEEVKVLIKASWIARQKGIKQGLSVKEICQKAGISRKTGYQWLKQEEASKAKKQEEEKTQADISDKYEKLLKENAWLRFENEGIRLSMEIHGLGDVIKKNSI
jgi:transposase